VKITGGNTRSTTCRGHEGKIKHPSHVHDIPKTDSRGPLNTAKHCSERVQCYYTSTGGERYLEFDKSLAGQGQGRWLGPSRPRRPRATQIRSYFGKARRS
jgi:hypothetical protein